MWRSFVDPKWKYWWYMCQRLPHSSLSENLFDVIVFLVTVSNQLWSKLYCCAAFEQMIPLATPLFVYRFYSSWVLDCDKSKLKPELHITCFVLSSCPHVPHICHFVCSYIVLCLEHTKRTEQTNSSRRFGNGIFSRKSTFVLDYTKVWATTMRICIRLKLYKEFKW